ncbi:MAG TPA: MmcQ/YjbR family DNA-binding protein [Chitinophagaceae bacterium]
MSTDFLQQYCGTWPAVTSDIKWDDDLCFSVGGKMFCVAWLGHPTRISFKVTEEEFDEICVKDGFSPAPYMARAKWVLVSDVSKLTRDEWEYYVRQSYHLVLQKLPKKTLKDLKLDGNEAIN